MAEKTRIIPLKYHGKNRRDVTMDAVDYCRVLGGEDGAKMAEMYRRGGCVCMSESDFMALVASRIEVAREADGRWIAEIPALPGCMVYGEIEDTARQAVEALALRIMQTERWTDAGDPPVAA